MKTEEVFSFLGLPNSIMAVQKILVLLVRVRITVGQLQKRES